MRESAPSSRSRRRQPETAAAVTPASAARSAARSPGLQPRDELHLPVEGQVYGLLAGRRGDARRLRPIYNGRAAAAGQLGRLGQAEPRRDGLHGELPGLQRVHADSNPDTGVSNFLSAPPWFDEIGHFSSVRRTCQQPQATPMLVTRQFESRAFFGTRPDKSRLAFQPKIAEWRVASTPNQHCRRGDAEMASGTQKSRTSQHEQRPPPPTQTRRSSSTLKRPLLPRAWKHEVTESSPDSIRHAGKTGSPCAFGHCRTRWYNRKHEAFRHTKTHAARFPGRHGGHRVHTGCNFRCPFCHNADLVLGERSVTTCAPRLRQRSGDGADVPCPQARRTRSPPMPASEKAEVPLAGAGPDAAGLFPPTSSKTSSPSWTSGRGFWTAYASPAGSRCSSRAWPISALTCANADSPSSWTRTASFPDRLRALVSQGLVDYVAMDVKNAPERYEDTVGVDGLDLARVRESVSFLLEGSVPYEFRTTVVRELHAESDLRSLAEWIARAEAWFLQSFIDEESVAGRHRTIPCLGTRRAAPHPARAAAHRPHGGPERHRPLGCGERPDVAALAKDGLQVPRLLGTFGAVGIVHDEATSSSSPTSTMKWPVVVKSPGATLQMIGLPASKAAVTEEASAAPLRTSGQLSGAFAHEQPGRFAAGNVALALAERAQGCRVVILLARDAHVDHGQACGAAPRFLDGASRIRCACPGGIGLIQPGDLPLAPLAHRRADGPGDRARARRRACVHAARPTVAQTATTTATTTSTPAMIA